MSSPSHFLALAPWTSPTSTITNTPATTKTNSPRPFQGRSRPVRIFVQIFVLIWSKNQHDFWWRWNLLLEKEEIPCDPELFASELFMTNYLIRDLGRKTKVVLWKHRMPHLKLSRVGGGGEPFIKPLVARPGMNFACFQTPGRRMHRNGGILFCATVKITHLPELCRAIYTAVKESEKRRKNRTTERPWVETAPELKQGRSHGEQGDAKWRIFSSQYDSRGQIRTGLWKWIVSISKFRSRDVAGSDSQSCHFFLFFNFLQQPINEEYF